MMRRSSWRGTALLGAVAGIALLAPLLAGGSPLVVWSAEGVGMPALSGLLSIVPQAGPAAPSRETPSAGWRLFPPVAIDPLSIDLDARLSPPGRTHWLGTDELGRDILSRLIHGARPSLMVALLATLFSLAIGVPLGAAAGYAGRVWDLALSRLIEAILSFPSLILVLLLAGLSVAGAGPARSLLLVGIAIGMARAGVIARYMRGEVVRLSVTEMTLAARASGAGAVRIVTRHLIPAGIGPVATVSAFGAGSAVVAEASLSFLGLGVQPPAPTWGQMMQGVVTYGPSCWWMLVFPGAAVAATVAAFNLLGESLRRR